MDAGEPALAVQLADRVDLDRDGPAVLVLQVEAQDLDCVGSAATTAQRSIATCIVSGVTIRSNVSPTSSSGRNPVRRSIVSEMNRKRVVRVGAEDDVRGVLDEEPVALLGRAELVLEALALADVAGDAPDRRQPPLVVHLPDDAHLERDLPAALLVPDEQAVRRRPAGVGRDLREPLARLRERLHVDEVGERPADHLAGRPADDLLGPVAVERVDPVAVHLEDEVRRRLDEAAVALLGRLETREEVRVGERDRRVVREGLERREPVAGDRPGLPVRRRRACRTPRRRAPAGGAAAIAPRPMRVATSRSSSSRGIRGSVA